MTSSLGGKIGLLFSGVVLCVSCAADKQPTITEIAPLPTETAWSLPVVQPVEEPVVPEPVKKPSKSEKVFPYVPDEEIETPIAVGAPLTIKFHKDERVITVIGGDRSALPSTDTENPWLAKIGEPGSPQPLVHISVSKPGVTTSFTIPTSMRIYQLRLKSVTSSPVRFVRFDYGPEPRKEDLQSKPFPDPSIPRHYDTGYTIGASDPAPVWTPTRVVSTPFHDGYKTYIFFPPRVQGLSVPMIRLIGPNGYEMVNGTMTGSVMRLDHLIERAVELRLGIGETAELVRITRVASVAITCPGSDDCPVWPTTLAQAGR